MRTEIPLLQQARIERKRRLSQSLNLDINKMSRSEILQKLLPNYVIQPKPKEFHDSTKPDKLIIGGYGSGKTYTLTAEGIFLNWVKRPLPVLFVIQTQANSNLTTTQTLIKLCKDNALDYEMRDIKGVIYFDIAWGTKENDIGHFYLVSGYNPDSIAGPTVSAVLFDECFKLKKATIEVGVARARDPRSVINEVAFASTIDPLNTEWGQEQCENDYKGDDKTLKVVIPTPENKFATPEFIERMKRTYDEETQRVLIHGENISVKGKAVYRYKDQTKKSFESLIIPRKKIMKILLGFDFNVGLMCAAEIWLDGKIRRQIDEYKIEDSNTEELCDLIINRLIEKYPGINGDNAEYYSIYIFMDAAAKQRKSSAKIGSTDAFIIRDAFIANGFRVHIFIPDENPPVRDRVQFTNNLIDKEEFVIYDNCKHAILCRKFTKWKEGSDGFSIVTVGRWSHMSAAADYALWFSRRMINGEQSPEGQRATGGVVMMMDEREFK